MRSNWNEGCRLHNRYEAKTGTFGHTESPSSPYYTAQGADAAGKSVLSGGQSGPRDAWVDAVYHRTSVLNPRLRTSGFDASSGDTCMRIYDGHDDSSAARTPTLRLYPWPPNGARDQPKKFTGGESPSPFDDAPGTTELGLLLSVNVNGPWPSFYQPETDVHSASLGTSGGVGIPISISDRGSPNGNVLDGGFGIFPRRALADATTYIARAAGKVLADGKSYPFTIRWQFETSFLDPETYFEVDQDSASIQTASQAPVRLGARNQRTGARSTGATIRGEGSWRHHLGTGRWSVCATQVQLRPYRGFRECQGLIVPGRPKLTISKGRRRGRRVRFRVKASPSLVGRRAKVSMVRFRRRCGRLRSNVDGSLTNIIVCANKRVGNVHNRRITLARSQRVRFRAPARRQRGIKLVIRVSKFERNGIPYEGVRAVRRYKRR